MKSLKLSIMALAIGISAHAQNADEIFKKHVDAVGGMDKWNKVNSMKLTGSMSAQGMEIGVTQYFVNEKGMRTEIALMGQTGYIILTPTGGWSYMPFGGQTKPEEMKSEDLKLQKDQLNFRNLQFIDKSKIDKMVYDGTDTVNSVPCYKLKVTSKEGDEQTCYIDSKTYYMVRAEKKMKMGDEEQEAGTSFSDFKKLPEGIVMPMTWGTPQGDITFKTIEVNKPVDDKLFKPDAAK